MDVWNANIAYFKYLGGQVIRMYTNNYYRVAIMVTRMELCTEISR